MTFSYLFFVHCNVFSPGIGGVFFYCFQKGGTRTLISKKSTGFVILTLVSSYKDTKAVMNEKEISIELSHCLSEWGVPRDKEHLEFRRFGCALGGDSVLQSKRSR